VPARILTVKPPDEEVWVGGQPFVGHAPPIGETETATPEMGELVGLLWVTADSTVPVAVA